MTEWSAERPVVTVDRPVMSCDGGATVLRPDNPTTFLTNKATLIMWLKGAWNANYHLLSSFMFDVQREGGQIAGRFYVYIDGQRTEIESALESDVFYKVTVVYDGTLADVERVKAYVGELVEGVWGADNLQAMGEGLGSAPSAFGVFATDPVFFDLPGILAEVRLWSQALTPEQIAAETLDVNVIAPVVRHTMADLDDAESSPWRSTNIGSGGNAFDALAVGERTTSSELATIQETEWEQDGD